MPHLHQTVQRMPPIVPAPAPEPAEFKLNILSATGTGILLAAIAAGFAMRFSPAELLKTYGQTIWRVRYSLLTIALMLALGNVTKYSGTDATLGLALAHTGQLYPFFGTMLGWLGVALTGSDTASNVLFGSLQKITAHQLHISPVLMGAANSSGGVMGKMVDAQSIVVASTATNWYGHEGDILRYVFFHSLALAALVGILVYCQAYIAPFTAHGSSMTNQQRTGVWRGRSISPILLILPIRSHPRRGLRENSVSGDDGLFLRELDHPAFGIAEIRVWSDTRHDDTPPPQFPEDDFPIFHRDIKMKVADHLPVIALSDRQRNAAELHFAVAIGPLAEHMRAENIHIEIADIFPPLGENSHRVARRMGLVHGSEIFVRAVFGFGRGARQIDHGLS